MPRSKTFTPEEKLEISRFCACLGNPTILSILEELAWRVDSDRNDFIEVKGVSKFTTQMNLKYMRKFELVTGSLSPESPYKINYTRLDEYKELLDIFYTNISRNRAKAATRRKK